ncbi:glutaredoxin-C1 [Cinnamomum micranthum f. kanehirae]|uniref:Glutaredoxin-C1 n=1 Tax=Cinnamomum micranthum f. kanehirae TaxID=337451 RepID=A0A3S3NHP1_9MAGN|nr:glutaredoxin-C1 [Cinnamomum micranthum f. kanehirae]
MHGIQKIFCGSHPTPLPTRKELHLPLITMDQITDMVEQNALVIFSKSSCCMCHAMKTFFTDLGANAFVYELDHNGPVERALIRLLGCNPPVPAVFVGGQLVGTTKHSEKDPSTIRMEQIQILASESGLMIFSKTSCCIVKTSFIGLGANTVVYELDKGPVERELERALIRLLGCNPLVSTVFIGGQLVGTAKDVYKLHIVGRLTSML